MNKNLSQSNSALQSTQEPLETIENLILNIRGKQVMLDRDLARLYGVETRVLNQAVKRNIKRFPDDFMFQLTKVEIRNLTSQIVISSLENTDNKPVMSEHGGSRHLSFAFTESGIAMLSSVLKSEIAINVNIQIMRAFTAMRNTLFSHSHLYNRIEVIESNQLNLIEWKNRAEGKFVEIFNSISKYELPKQDVFFDGQLFDAHVLMSRLVASAKKRIVLIDNYVDESVLTLLLKRKDNVPATIYTMQMSGTFKLDLQKHNAQYSPVAVNIYTKAHDRFLITDDKIYHVGASVKDLGKKLCAVSLLSCIDADEMINRL